LKSLPIPVRPWQNISWNFVTDLPNPKGFIYILVIVDRLIKMRHLLPGKKNISTRDLGELLLMIFGNYMDCQILSPQIRERFLLWNARNTSVYD
jgi:hypothetical protein